VIWERDLGIVHKLLVTPTPRTALVLGKGLSAGCRALSQAFIIFFQAWLLGVKLDWCPQAVAGVLLAVVLGAALFSKFSLIIAFLVKTRERFMGIGQVLTMPMFFASNAIYPLAIDFFGNKVLWPISPFLDRERRRKSPEKQGSKPNNHSVLPRRKLIPEKV